MIDIIGRAIERLMRACVASQYLPRSIKALVIMLGIFLIKRRVMHAFQPGITTQFGHTLAGAPADSSLNQIIFFRDVFEPVLSTLVWNMVEDGDTCVDAGANVGYFTLLMAQKAGSRGRVISIEAAPGNVARLIQNVRLNRFDDRVEVVPAVCSDSPGIVTFHVNSKSDMSCRVELPRRSELDYWLMRKHWQPIAVRSDRLSALVGRNAADVSFIKVDVEGTEHKLCKDILDHFTHSRLCVAIEAKQPYVRKTLEPFEEAGFVVYNLRNNYLWVVDNKIESATYASFADLYGTKYMVDVLLSRKEIPLERLNTQPPGSR